MAKIYLMAGRKAWHYEIPDGWEETHWERFDYIECGIYEKPDIALTSADSEWVQYYSAVPAGWIDPAPKQKSS